MVDEIGQLTGSENQEAVPSGLNPVAEKMIPQSKANDLVSYGIAKGYDKGHQAGYEKARAELMNQQNAQPTQAASTAQDQPLTRDEMDRRIAESHEKARQQAIVDQLETQFKQKLEMGKAKIADYDEKVKPIVDEMYANPQHYGNLAVLVNSIDNTADVLRDLAENPAKKAQFIMMSHYSPRDAAMEIKKLSDSIKLNEQSLAQSKATSVNAPLSQTQSSPVGLGDGKMNVSSRRKLPYLRA